eukprot:3559062-Pleurochrysis_carterae.AAC.5
MFVRVRRCTCQQTACRHSRFRRVSDLVEPRIVRAARVVSELDPTLSPRTVFEVVAELRQPESQPLEGGGERRRQRGLERVARPDGTLLEASAQRDVKLVSFVNRT